MQDSLQLYYSQNAGALAIVKEEQDDDQWVNTIVEHSSGTFTQPVYYEGVPNRFDTPIWVIILLLIGFSCIAVSRSVYRKRFNMLLKTLTNWKLSKQIIRYEKVYTHPVNVLMTFNFIISLPLFFSLVYFKLFNPDIIIEKQYLFLLFPLVLYLLVKIAFYKFSGWLWNEKGVIEEYLFQSNLFNKYAGAGFLILTSMVVYSPISIFKIAQSGLILLGLLALFQLIRGVVVGLENGKHLFFIIAYLCTLEILPWLVIGKWIQINL